LIVVVCAAYAAHQITATPAASTAAAKQQIVTVQRGTLAASVSTTGSVVAVTSSKLTFSSSGTISKVLVKVGDTVTAGQDLAELDKTNLTLTVNQAQAALMTAQSKLDLMKQGSTSNDIAASQANLASAQAKLALLQAGPAAVDVQAAEAQANSAQTNLESAQAKLAALQALPNPDDVRTAQMSVQQAQLSLNSAQINRNGTCGHGDTTNACYQADAQVGSAQTGLAAANANLATISLPATATDLGSAQEAITAAQQSLDSANANLAQVKAGATAAAILAAQASVTSARSALALKLQPYTDADLKSAQASVDQANVSLASAQNALNAAVLTAPFAGNVSAVSMNASEPSAGSSILLIDPHALRIDTTVGESDVARLQVGQNTNVTFDSLPGKSYTGTVIAVAPTGTVQQGVVTYVVSLGINDTTDLRPGMTANATIVYLQKDNVLMVPNRAVMAQGRSRVVNIPGDTAPVVRTVQVGISNDQFTEIVSGLQEGDKVIISTTSTTAPRVNGAGIGGLGGGPGGGFGGVTP
jgi:HlyD family secretion protein